MTTAHMKKPACGLIKEALDPHFFLHCSFTFSSFHLSFFYSLPRIYGTQSFRTDLNSIDLTALYR